MDINKIYSSREACDGWECITLHEKFKAAAALYGDKIAVIDDNDSLTYTELCNAALSLAKYFHDIGICKNDTVVVQMPNKIIFPVLFFGLLEIGAIPILMLPAHREAELNGIFQAAEPKAYISVSDMPEYNFVPMATEVAAVHNCSEFLFFDYELEAVMDRHFSGDIVCDKPDYKDIAVLLLSGGTTGVPKLIPRTHGDYLYNSQMMVKRCDWNENTVFLAAIPVAHNFALATPGLIGTLISGGTLVLTMYVSPVDLLDGIEEHRITAACMVPTLVNLCAEYRYSDSSSDISSLQYLQVGGASFLPDDAERAIELFQCTLIQVYGMAEGLICTTSIEDSKEVIINTQGKPCSPYDEVRIVDENGCQTAVGVSGEIITRGPYTITSYYKMPKSGNSSFTVDGWYRPGDKGMLRQDGNIQVLGRVKEMINRAGEKIVPVMLEEHICTNQQVRSCVIAGVPDHILGSRICAFVITKAGVSLTLEELKAYLRTKGIAEYALPDQLYIINALPLTAVGKVDKNKLIEAVLAAEAEKKRDLYEGTGVN